MVYLFFHLSFLSSFFRPPARFAEVFSHHCFHFLIQHYGDGPGSFWFEQDPKPCLSSWQSTWQSCGICEAAQNSMSRSFGAPALDPTTAQYGVRKPAP
ncbi:hypothetical protein B0T19DRAFT_413923 [Cercophora scortea]|uniref:Uncharacterized protein n=1 Tax=Cercophora scortea TaxID=314031 RepID=A0AAE0IWC4_9PEZI|nr:hypothetical protein B0T19DRAFT_413923 [Cercophora scortea]